MRFTVYLAILACVGCGGTMIVTGGNTVVCQRDHRIELSSPISREYQLVFTGKQYELRLIDSDKRVAVYDTCVIERTFGPPRFE